LRKAINSSSFCWRAAVSCASCSSTDHFAVMVRTCSRRAILASGCCSSRDFSSFSKLC
jgi:hypothetical protein